MTDPALTIKRVERHAGYPDLWLTTNGRPLFLSASQAEEIRLALNLLHENPTVLFFENETARLVREAAELRERRIEVGKGYAPMPGAKPTRRIPSLDELA